MFTVFILRKFGKKGFISFQIVFLEDLSSGITQIIVLKSEKIRLEMSLLMNISFLCFHSYLGREGGRCNSQKNQKKNNMGQI